MLATWVCASLGSGPYGLASTPPRGWRSWNAFGADVTQAKMEAAMDAMADRSRTLLDRDGTTVRAASLADLGFVHAGLDDAWQACGAGVEGSFHDADGNPLVNGSRFPKGMGALVTHAHTRGLLAGFYINNCICAENQFRSDPSMTAKIFARTVAAIARWGFDGVKIDSCSGFLDMPRWAALLNASGRPVLTENCHNSDGQEPCAAAKADPEHGVCPYNLWRTSADIAQGWGSWFHNLQSMRPWLGEPPLSRPGRWAYPDMLEIGNLGSIEESRAHLSAWAVTSAPLILGHDPTDTAAATRVWDVVSNVEVLDVAEAWAGHPGRYVRNWTTGAEGKDEAQLWAKPVTNGTTGGAGGSPVVAALLLNTAAPGLEGNGTTFATISLETDLGLAPGEGAAVRDLWARRDIGWVAPGGSFEAARVGGRSCLFLLFTPYPAPPHTPPPPPAPPSPGPAPISACDAQCFAAGHCCSGDVSGCQQPSCAMGCYLADELAARAAVVGAAGAAGAVAPAATVHAGAGGSGSVARGGGAAARRERRGSGGAAAAAIAGTPAAAAVLSECVSDCTAAGGSCDWYLSGTTVHLEMCFDCGPSCDACPAEGECAQGCAFALNAIAVVQ